VKAKKFKFKKGDTVKLKTGNKSLIGYFPNKTNVIIKVINVDLGYAHQFVYFEIDGEEHGFYSQAFEIAK